MQPPVAADLAIEVENLTYGYHGGKPVLRNINLKVQSGSRVLLVGANGTGKTTMMSILAGKRLVHGKVRVHGVDPFQQSPDFITILASEWSQNPIVRKDIVVEQLVRSNGGDVWTERRDMLIDLLDVDTQWHMHQVSDGERRRVQLLLGLIKPYSVLYLDEVTVDLDVMVRRDFLHFLRQETEQRGATIVYATHIFDGVGDWATHICHMSNGTVRVMQPLTEVQELIELKDQHNKGGYGDSPLLRLVERWLREEFEERKRLRKLHVEEPPNEIEKKKDMREYGDKYYNYWNH